MNNKFYRGCIGSFLIAVCLSYACNNSKSFNKDNYLKFENDTISAPLIPVGDSGIYIFNQKNIGNQKIKIKNIGISCGCTIVKFDTTYLTPGGKDSLKLKYVNFSDTGSVYKYIVVETDSQIEPLHSLTLFLNKSFGF